MHPQAFASGEQTLRRCVDVFIARDARRSATGITSSRHVIRHPDASSPTGATNGHNHGIADVVTGSRASPRLHAQAAGGDGQAGGSDLFIAADFPPSMKSHGQMKPLTAQKLTGEVTAQLAHALMNEQAARRVRARRWSATSRSRCPGVSRFRVNVFVQQGSVGMVIRTIAAEIPNFEKLRLPEVLKDVVMTKRGLVLVVGATGSGKSTTLAAMIDHRNRTSAGHIITVEDPVEYVHVSQKSLVTHREVGVDTHSLAPRAEEHAAPGAGRDPGRRDPRRRDDGARDRLRRDRPPVPGHAARQQRQPDDRAHHQLLPGGAPQAAADGPVGQPARDRLAAPGAHARTARAASRRSRSCSTRRPSPRRSSRASSTSSRAS